MIASPKIKLDIVYTFVNNNDKNWQKKYFKYQNNINSSRFNFHGEILFSLKTVEKFFNWVNKIYIVNDDQEFSLDFLSDDFAKKIVFVDHKEIIPHKYLPTFNSLVIECFLWNIKDLSEYFIYLNDDIFFGNYVNISNFFTKKRVFKQFCKILSQDYNKELLKKEGYLISSQSSFDIFKKKIGKSIYLRSNHISWNLNKTICKLCYNIFFKEFQKTFPKKIRKYNKPNKNLSTKEVFSFLILSQLLADYFKVSISYNEKNRLIIQELNEYKYKELIKKKPFMFNINTLQDNQLELWIKLQTEYFLEFPQDKIYDNFKNNINNFIEKLNK